MSYKSNTSGNNQSVPANTDKDAPLTYLVIEPYTDRDRLFVQYELLRNSFNRRFDRALQLGELSTDPATANWRALDVGCGEGLFAGEVVSRYPNASIVGFDKDKEAITTANTVFAPKGDLRFYVHDVLEPLPHQFAPDNTDTGVALGVASSPATEDISRPGVDFDIIYAHFVLMHVRQPSTALANLAAALKPGGVIYLCDSGVETLPFPHPSLVALLEKAGSAVARIATPDFAHRHKEYLEQAGFEQIETGTSVYVVGGPTEAGQRMLNNLISAMRSARRGLVEGLHLISGDEFDEHMRRLTTEITTDMSCEWEIANAIGRKPRND